MANITTQGRKGYDSKKEERRAKILKLMEKQGTYNRLERAGKV